MLLRGFCATPRGYVKRKTNGKYRHIQRQSLRGSRDSPGKCNACGNGLTADRPFGTLVIPIIAKSDRFVKNLTA